MSAPQNPNDPQPAPRRSRGPRSLDALAKTRRNALRHGLTATLPDGEAELRAMNDFAETWTRQLGCDNDAEEALIRSSALAYARLERCRKAEEAALTDSARKAVERWQKVRRHAVRKLGQSLPHDPANTVADLEASSFGCEWLLRHWLRLDAKLEQGIAWDRDDQVRAMHLLGFYPQAPGPDAPFDIRRAWHLIRCCSRCPFDPVAGLPTELIPARAELRRLITEELDRLDTLRDQCWHDLDGPEADAVAQLGLIDTTRDGQLRQRYRREAFSEMIRGINQVMRIRVERSKDQDRQWHQAHPHGSSRRSSSPPASFIPETPPPMPQPAADPGRPPAPDPSSVRSRNESPEPASEAASDRLNPSSDQEIRREPALSEPRRDERTEPRSTAFSDPSADPDSPLRPPVEALHRPSDRDDRR
ncbi:hypothetical protein [Tautonia marina]|uniref:hypothetical protein n=1 Tax=Tautonia marina TaxID=2653855 RepID=UPI001260AF9D|nr:hypothetical protein [Tautonia marina]